MISSVTNTQVAVKFRRNVGSLSIDMSTSRSTYGSSVSRHIDRCLTDMLADISSDTSQSTYRPTLDRHVDRYIGRLLVDMSTDIWVDCRSMCQPIYRLRGAQNTHDPRILLKIFVFLLTLKCNDCSRFAA